MKKIVSLISILLVAVLVTGCSGAGASSGTITCVSESHGENPSITTYEKYVVEDNKITEFTSYNTLVFDDDYFDVLSLDDILEVYSKDSNYIDVEKVDANTLKVVRNNPTNVFENMDSDNMIELIRSTLEDNPLSIYSYTCEIK